MADIAGMLDELQQKTRKNPEWKEAFFRSREAEDPLSDFCRRARECGIEIDSLAMHPAGADVFASMRRTTNGGGENSPKLAGEDDFYELFFAGLEQQIISKE